MIKRKISGLALLVLGATVTACSPQGPSQQLTYNDHVKPILDKHCAECHAPLREGAHKSGFVVNSYDDIMVGTRFGPVVIPGSSISSSLYRMVSGEVDPAIRMPHGRDPLTDAEVKTIKAWIDQGARNS